MLISITSRRERPAGDAPVRPPRRPRLLACDIDGTITTSGNEIAPEVRRAIGRIALAGIHVVLATGRSPWAGVAMVARDLGLPGAHIMVQGAVTAVPDGHVIRRRAMPARTYLDVLHVADRLGLDPVVSVPDGHRAERFPIGLDVPPPSRPEARHFRYVTDLTLLADHAPLRVFLPTSPARFEAVREACLERFDAIASVLWSDTRGVEILAPGTDKGTAVAAFAADLGIHETEVAAVGDGPNDLAMLRRAGWSAAMASAPDDVRAAADIVVPARDGIGVLAAFDWFFPHLGLLEPEPAMPELGHVVEPAELTAS